MSRRPRPSVLRSVVAGCIGLGALTACRAGEASAWDADLAEARSAWASTDVDTYRYVLELRCQVCETEPIPVEVVDGQLVTELPDLPLLDGAPLPVEASFALIADLIADSQPGTVLDVAYDTATGVPTELDADPIPNANDDELGFNVTDLVIGEDVAR